jgi:hypothetical protein
MLCVRSAGTLPGPHAPFALLHPILAERWGQASVVFRVPIRGGDVRIVL